MGEEDSEGNATGEDYFHVPGVASVRWDTNIQAVVETWEGWADSDEFQAILDAGVQAMSENRGSRWLADCRLQRVLKAADQEAGNKRWLPRALAAGLKRFAVVLPASGLAKANIQDHLRAAASKQLEMAYFATLEEAQQWLVQA
jgi:SpoIIAA-like